EQPELFSTPKPKPHRVMYVGRTSQLHSGFQDGGDSGAVVVDSRASRDAIQMSADHDHVSGGSGSRLGDDVTRGLGADTGVEFDRGLAGLRAHSGTVGFADAEHRDP